MSGRLKAVVAFIDPAAIANDGGASDDVLTLELVSGVLTAKWKPGGSGGVSVLDDLGDVDTVTVPPTNGAMLVYDASTSQWRPGKILVDDATGEILIDDATGDVLFG